MKVAIMQPYFMPYIGYFQLMAIVDTFVIYDNIEYTKKGWINRNRILVNKNDLLITLPLKKDSDYLNINERYLSNSFNSDKLKLMNRIKEAYIKAPFFKETFLLIEQIFSFKDDNLFNFIYNSIIIIKNHLGIDSKIIRSSTLGINIEKYTGQNKVIEICKHLEAESYINPIGGIILYNKHDFKTEEINLKFIKSSLVCYKQFDNDFIPWLSIIDVLMFNSIEEVKEILNKYELV